MGSNKTIWPTKPELSPYQQRRWVKDIGQEVAASLSSILSTFAAVDVSLSATGLSIADSI